MMDYTSTQARTKGVAPTTNHEKSHTEAVLARSSKALPPPSADRVDKMYLQLAEIHAVAIVVAQLAKCVCWHLTRPLTWCMPAQVGEGPPRSPPR
jgi:hypothetical protein